MLISCMSRLYAHCWPVTRIVREKETTSADSDSILRFSHPHARQYPTWKQWPSHIFPYRSRAPDPRNWHGMYKLVAVKSLHVAIQQTSTLVCEVDASTTSHQRQH